MKSLTITILITTCATFYLGAQDTKVETLKSFLSGILPLDSVQFNKQTPIKTINEIAQVKATKYLFIMKDNITEIIEEIKKHEFCFITVENFTIVKITDVQKCQQSGSWGVCMPFAEGYTQKGGLVKREDYLNNIIGRDDAQVRIIYLFNPK